MLSTISGLEQKMSLCLFKLEGLFILVDPWRQFLLKMSGHSLKGKHIQLLRPHNVTLQRSRALVAKKGIMNYTFSLILVVSAKWLLNASHLDDISFTFVHLQLHLLVNHRPRWSLVLIEYIKAIVLLINHESSPFIGKSVPRWENNDHLWFERAGASFLKRLKEESPAKAS